MALHTHKSLQLTLQKFIQDGIHGRVLRLSNINTSDLNIPHNLLVNLQNLKLWESNTAHQQSPLEQIKPVMLLLRPETKWSQELSPILIVQHLLSQQSVHHLVQASAMMSFTLQAPISAQLSQLLSMAFHVSLLTKHQPMCSVQLEEGPHHLQLETLSQLIRMEAMPKLQLHLIFTLTDGQTHKLGEDKQFQDKETQFMFQRE